MRIRNESALPTATLRQSVRALKGSADLSRLTLTVREAMEPNQGAHGMASENDDGTYAIELILAPRNLVYPFPIARVPGGPHVVIETWDEEWQWVLAHELAHIVDYQNRVRHEGDPLDGWAAEVYADWMATLALFALRKEHR